VTPARVMIRARCRGKLIDRGAGSPRVERSDTWPLIQELDYCRHPYIDKTVTLHIDGKT